MTWTINVCIEWPGVNRSISTYNCSYQSQQQEFFFFFFLAFGCAKRKRMLLVSHKFVCPWHQNFSSEWKKIKNCCFLFFNSNDHGQLFSQKWKSKKRFGEILPGCESLLYIWLLQWNLFSCFISLKALILRRQFYVIRNTKRNSVLKKALFYKGCRVLGSLFKSLGSRQQRRRI